MKYFISQPMNGLSDNVIVAKREEILSKLKMVDPDAELIDSFFQSVPYAEQPVWYLGEAIKKMAEADVVVLASGYNDARGCRIEDIVCNEYGIIEVLEKDINTDFGKMALQKARDFKKYVDEYEEMIVDEEEPGVECVPL